MSINPHKNTDQPILFQTQQIPTFGCCYTNLQIAHYNNRNPTLQRRRFYSEPKELQNRKIDLTIGKRRHSLIKNDEDQQSTARKQRFQTAASSTIKLPQHAKVTLTINSKMTTQKSFLKTSKVRFNQDIDICSFKNKQRVIYLKNTNPHTHPPLYIKYPYRQDLESFKLISEISIVEQEFVSQGSESLQALTLINQLHTCQNMNLAPKLCQTKLPNVPNQISSLTRGNLVSSGTNQMDWGGKGFIL